MSGHPAWGCRVENASLLGADLGQRVKQGWRRGSLREGAEPKALVACCELTPSQCTRQLRKPHARNEGHDCISQMMGGTDLARVTPSSG